MRTLLEQLGIKVDSGDLRMSENTGKPYLVLRGTVRNPQVEYQGKELFGTHATITVNIHGIVKEPKALKQAATVTRKANSISLDDLDALL